MKEDSKNTRRRKLINLTKDYEVSPGIVSACVEIFKVNIDIVFERPESELAQSVRFLILYLFFKRNNKDYIYFLKDI